MKGEAVHPRITMLENIWTVLNKRIVEFIAHEIMYTHSHIKKSTLNKSMNGTGCDKYTFLDQFIKPVC